MLWTQYCPWCYVLALSQGLGATLGLRVFGLCCRAYTQNHATPASCAQVERARGSRSVVDVTFNVEPVPATYNVTHHRGEPKEERGGALGLQPPPLPNRKLKNTDFVDTVTSNISRNSPCKRNRPLISADD
jgi:hypothetical protein